MGGGDIFSTLTNSVKMILRGRGGGSTIYLGLVMLGWLYHGHRLWAGKLDELDEPEPPVVGDVVDGVVPGLVQV